MPEVDSSPRSPDPPPEQDPDIPAPAIDGGLAASDGPGRSEMPFLEHLEELRWRILKAAGSVLLGAIICFAFSDPLLKVLTRPYEQAVHSILAADQSGPGAALMAWVREQVGRWQGEEAGSAGKVAEAAVTPAAQGDAGDPGSLPEIRGVPPQRQLQSLRPMTYFFVSLQVALLGGLILALPVVFYQLWRFVAPGLLKRERRLVLPVVALSVLCFGLGAAIAYFIVLPLGLRFFLGLEPADMTSQWAVDEYISFVLRLLLGFGIVFEMPVVTLFLSRLGLVTPEYMRRVRRYAIVAIFVLAAVFTPPDPISQILMALPLLGLYEVSIWVCKVTYRRPGIS